MKLRQNNSPKKYVQTLMKKDNKQILAQKLHKLTIKFKSLAFMKIFMSQSSRSKRYSKIRSYDIQTQAISSIISMLKKKLQQILIRAFIELKNFTKNNVIKSTGVQKQKNKNIINSGVRSQTIIDDIDENIKYIPMIITPLNFTKQKSNQQLITNPHTYHKSIISCHINHNPTPSYTDRSSKYSQKILLSSSNLSTKSNIESLYYKIKQVNLRSKLQKQQQPQIQDIYELSRIQSRIQGAKSERFDKQTIKSSHVVRKQDRRRESCIDDNIVNGRMSREMFGDRTNCIYTNGGGNYSNININKQKIHNSRNYYQNNYKNNIQNNYHNNVKNNNNQCSYMNTPKYGSTYRQNQLKSSRYGSTLNNPINNRGFYSKRQNTYKQNYDYYPLDKQTLKNMRELQKKDKKQIILKKIKQLQKTLRNQFSEKEQQYEQVQYYKNSHHVNVNRNKYNKIDNSIKLQHQYQPQYQAQYFQPQYSSSQYSNSQYIPTYCHNKNIPSKKDNFFNINNKKQFVDSCPQYMINSPRTNWVENNMNNMNNYQNNMNNYQNNMNNYQNNMNNYQNNMNSYDMNHYQINSNNNNNHNSNSSSYMNKINKNNKRNTINAIINKINNMNNNQDNNIMSFNNLQSNMQSKVNCRKQY